MARVEIYQGKKDDPELLLTSEFGFLPRIGEYLSIEADSYFRYYKVVEIWHRRDEGGNDFIPCIRVEEDD